MSAEEKPVVKQFNGHGNRRFEIVFPENSEWAKGQAGLDMRAVLHEALGQYIDHYVKETT